MVYRKNITIFFIYLKYSYHNSISRANWNLALETATWRAIALSFFQASATSTTITLSYLSGATITQLTPTTVATLLDFTPASATLLINPGASPKSWYIRNLALLNTRFTTFEPMYYFAMDQQMSMLKLSAKMIAFWSLSEPDIHYETFTGNLRIDKKSLLLRPSRRIPAYRVHYRTSAAGNAICLGHICPPLTTPDTTTIGAVTYSYCRPRNEFIVDFGQLALKADMTQSTFMRSYGSFFSYGQITKRAVSPISSQHGLICDSNLYSIYYPYYEGTATNTAMTISLWFFKKSATLKTLFSIYSYATSNRAFTAIAGSYIR